MKITNGNTVSVSFNGAQFTLSHKAIVRHVPIATGDSWVFEDVDSGDIHYISEGCTVTKLKDNT